MKKLVYSLSLFGSSLLMMMSCDTLVSGCTDSECANYNVAAIEDDGSCDCNNPGSYVIPETYDFANVDYSGQTTRLEMLAEMVTYLKTANTPGVSVSADNLNNMFANENSPFSDADLNASTKQIKNKTYELHQSIYEGYFDDIATISGGTEAGENGVAGVVYNFDSTKNYLFDANGFEPTQLIEKGLFGAFLFNQIANVYLSDDKIGNTVDNETVTDGKGTPMEHHWDEAFGYFGVPVDFPTNTDGLVGIGKYCNGREELLMSNEVIMNAFIKGRAAISNSDMVTKDSMVTIIADEIEKVLAATAVHYINSGKSNLTDDALRNHALSEAVAFIGACIFNPNGKMDATKAQEIIDMIGGNLYEVSLSGLNAARDEISTIYGLDNIKDEVL